MDTIPIKALFDENADEHLRRSARMAISRADVIIGVSAETQREFTVFGTPALEETVRLEKDVALRTVRVVLRESAGDLEKLLRLVRDIKGRP